MLFGQPEKTVSLTSALTTLSQFTTVKRKKPLSEQFLKQRFASAHISGHLPHCQTGVRTSSFSCSRSTTGDNLLVSRREHWYERRPRVATITSSATRTQTR